MRTYDKVSNDHSQEEERNTDETGADDALPHRLYPLPAEHPENDHERVKKINKVPSRHRSPGVVLDRFGVVGPEQLHAHHGEYEDDDGQHEAEVTERTHCPTDDADEEIQRRPRLGQFEHS